MLTLAGAAQAAGKFNVPEGCTAFLTVQHSDCQVSVHYRCDAEPAGDEHEVYADADGLIYMSHIDSETRWLTSTDLVSGDEEKLADEAEPASFTALLSNGRDDFDFKTVSQGGQTLRYHGFDKLTGAKLTIDGITLEETEFDLTTVGSDGTEVSHRSGHQMISRDWRLFFSNSEHYVGGDGTVIDFVSVPITFTFPGEPGFLSLSPQFGCDEQMTQAPGIGPTPARYVPMAPVEVTR